MVLMATAAYVRCALLLPHTMVSTTVPNTASDDLSVKEGGEQIPRVIQPFLNEPINILQYSGKKKPVANNARQSFTV